ncbi:MAG: glycoside hydrolase family 2 protein [Bacilli bacterium]|nr:glycoside hydrolase family 2 protein [Bacilli bacterium]
MRKILNINKDWLFIKEDIDINKDGINFENVNVPHTWNAIDGSDGGDDYYRGRCWYRKTLDIINPNENGKVFLEFRGVNSSCEVYLNKEYVGRHDGGYSTFRFDITSFVKDENVLDVCADNRYTDKVYPQKADFTFYGGIYRDVNIIYTENTHFDLEYFGGEGLMITPKVKEDLKGELEVKCFVKGCEDYKLDITIFDSEGKEFAKLENNTSKELDNIHLWDSVNDPYLYKCTAKLIVKDKEVDEVSDYFGFRSFSVDPKKGFFLNGRSFPLHGVCRHQDRKLMGNAITKAEHEEDIALIKEIGANTVRLAHYQHDDYFYDLCDKEGFVVWAEIPYISRHMVNANDNTVSQMTELIVQEYNHPSICFWGVSNEITMFHNDIKDMLENHKRLNDLCHTLDPTRLTTLACYSVCAPFNKSAHITDVVSWNLYLGWYVPGFFLNDLWFFIFKLFYPKRVIGMSEYGAEGMPNLHSLHPRRGDNTEEYQIKYHEYMLKFYEKATYLWATHVWNMFDFAADARNQGGEPGMNHKGLITYDRKTKKDSFYLYKAYWTNEPMVHITGKRFENRTGSKLYVKVYSNQEEVSLYNNGTLIETKKGNKVFNFKLNMEDVNNLEAVSGNVKDSCTIKHVDKPDPSYKLHKVDDKTKNWQK